MIIDKIKSEWDTFLKNGGIPVIEYELNTGECLAVSIQLIVSDYAMNNRIQFHFDPDNMPAYFSGDVNVISSRCGVYEIKINQFNCDSLDELLQQIHSEVLEGYVTANNLYKVEE